MTLRQAAKKAKKELEIDAPTVICKHRSTEELTTYNIALAHRIAEIMSLDCKEVVEKKRVKYIVTKTK